MNPGFGMNEWGREREFHIVGAAIADERKANKKTDECIKHAHFFTHFFSRSRTFRSLLEASATTRGMN